MKKAAHNSWLHCPRPNPDARLRLFCIPYAGGSATAYYSWAELLPDEVELYAVQLPGRGGRMLEAPLRRVDEVVDGLLEAVQPLLDKPHAWFGHSMGAMLAYELAQRLQQSAGHAPVHLFVSSFRAAHLQTGNAGRHLLNDTELKALLRELNGTPEALLDNDELMEMLLPVIRADLQLCDMYVCERAESLRCGITAFGGESDAGVSGQDLSAWRELTEGTFTQHMFQGDHFYLQSCERQLIARINEIIERMMSPRPAGQRA